MMQMDNGDDKTKTKDINLETKEKERNVNKWN